MLRQAQHDEMNSLLHRTEINSAQALRPVQHDGDERHPEPVSVFASRCRRVCSSAKWDMLRQAQHDEIYLLSLRTELNSAQALNPVLHIIRVVIF